MMKNIFIFVLLPSLLAVSVPASSKISSKDYLKRVVNIIERGNYLLGSRELYRLSRGSVYKEKRVQIKYTLGMAFLEMKLYHLASLQFVYVIKRTRGGSYRKKSLKKLSLILDYFQDDQLFCPLGSHIRESEYPNSVRNQLNFYFGKCAFADKNFKKAHYHFAKVSSQSHLLQQGSLLSRLVLRRKQPCQAVGGCI